MAASLLPKTTPHVFFPVTITNPSYSTPLLVLPFRLHSVNALKAASSDADNLRGKPLAFEYDDDDDKYVDWEDQILEDTVPLVGFVRMILHSGQYVSLFLTIIALPLL